MATVFATVTTPGPPGAAGPPGYSPQFIVAAGAPGAGVGNNGDMYIDSSNGNVYGPKAAGAWGAIQCNIKGVPGAPGVQGPPGYSPQYIVAAGAPSAGVGNNGDMYINSTTSDVYGPKTAGAWGAIQCNIKGVPGAPGVQGPPGVAYTPRGAWAAGTTYAQGDEATNAGILYISLQSGNLGNTPASSPTWWQNVASGGSQTPWVSNIDAAGHNLSSVGVLGIGPVAPVHPLHILTSAATANAPNAAIFIQRNVATSFAGIAWNAASVANPIIYSPISGDSICFGMDNGVSISEKVRITPGGSVGIGTSNPTNQFVISAGGASGFEINPNYTSGVATGTYIVAYDRNAGQYRDIIIDQNGAFVSSFRTNGCVGIGTVNPLAPLQVHVGVDANLGVRANLGRTSIGAFSDSGGVAAPLGFDASRVDFQCAVGIGFTPPATPLDVLATSADLTLRLRQQNGPTTNYFTFLVDSIATGALRIEGYNSGTVAIGFVQTRTGSVGIGNATPGYKLDVLGDVNCTGAFRVNGVALAAANITNAVDSTGSYANPAWITSLAYTKITGAPGAGGGITTQNVVTGSRVLGGVYQNTSKPQFVVVVATCQNSGGIVAYTDASTNPTTSVAVQINPTSTLCSVSIGFWVLPNNYFKVTGTATIQSWTEWF